MEVGAVAEENNLLRLEEHNIVFSAPQQARIDALLQEMHKAGVSSPSVKEAQQQIGEELYLALLDLRQLRQLNAEVVYEQQQYAQLTGQILEFLRRHGQINAAETRDLLQTSRKYAIALLEHLDDIKVTRRVGDSRELA